jgi:hypothetical protein
MAILTPHEIANFEADGVVLVRQAIPVAAMSEVTWLRLHALGIRQDDPSTWRAVNSWQMKRIRQHPCFAAIDSPRLHGAIDDLVGAGRWAAPAIWGMFRISAPAPGQPWQPTSGGWHSDRDPWGDQRAALFVFIHIDETVPGGGGTLVLAGSHRAQARLATDHGSRRRFRNAFQASSPWMRQLTGQDPVEGPRTRFLAADTPPDEHGVRMRVIECSGQPGDVWLCHPTIHHATNDNRSDRMRIMRLHMLNLNEGLGRDDPAPDTALARSVRAIQPA